MSKTFAFRRWAVDQICITNFTGIAPAVIPGISRDSLAMGEPYIHVP